MDVLDSKRHRELDAIWCKTPASIGSALRAADSEWCERLLIDACSAHATATASKSGGGDGVTASLSAWREVMTISWEQIHSGVWSEVAPVWRELYSFGCVGFVLSLLRFSGCSAAGAGSSTAATATTKPSADATRDTKQPTSIKPPSAPVVATASGGSGGGGTKRTLAQPSLELPDGLSTASILESGLKALDLAVLIGAGSGVYRTACDELITAIDKRLTALNPTGSDSSVQPPSKKVKSEATALLSALPAEPVIKFPIPRIAAPDLFTFQSKYLDPSTPVILTGVINHWPAYQSSNTGTATTSNSRRSWSNLEYLKSVGGRRTVPVEIGASYMSEKWSQKLMTLSEFIERHIERKTGSGSGGGGGGGEEGKSDIGYLAQHELFSQIPALRNDISIPDYCYLHPTTTVTGTDTKTHTSSATTAAAAAAATATAAADDESDDVASTSGEDEVRLNAWFGPRGTVSPCHTDPTHNLLTQVVGRKYIRLYHSSQTPRLYPNNQHPGSITTNTSRVDIERPDHQQFPLFADAQYTECILAPGEVLYIPVKCWHYVRSLDVSFSVSFWWQ